MKSFLKKLQAQYRRNCHLTSLAGCVLGVVFLLTGTGILYQALASARDRRRYAAPGKFVGVGGHRLHVLCSGEESPTVILDAGLSGSLLDWSLIQPEVSTFARICSYDRASCGWRDEGCLNNFHIYFVLSKRALAHMCQRSFGEQTLFPGLC
ncbi:hypothetical protein Krac_2340 [Ktedonobacter racemifer DSM 44963]|uniref:Uncharacterized protein n=1 Tax=Ktedonobacter racemifer DSM 44963 TaxID=485913 RepID=D6U527_KTERA|nr:hypothetical protein Krac_2340 [Ktedonobacter racemifer DSM 44963]